MSDTILVKKEGRIATITLNRPDHMNSLTASMIRCLEKELESLRDDTEIRALMLNGSGKAFCAGVDMHETTYNPLNSRIFLKSFNRMLKTLEMLPQPSIAVMNGASVAGGLELALACTFRIAATDAKMGLPEIRLGLVAAAGTTYRLPRLVGFGKAMEMCILGELMTGKEALSCGLVNWAVSKDEILEKAMTVAERLSESPPIAVSLVKDAMYTTATPHFDHAAFLEILSASVNHYSEDKKEGLAAFFDKRKAKFQGN